VGHLSELAQQASVQAGQAFRKRMNKYAEGGAQKRGR
jgi:hypothetical protein